MFTVESGVAMPGVKTKSGVIRSGHIFPIMDMEVGDSFFAGGYAVAGRKARTEHLKALSAYNFERQRPGTKWSVRTVTEDGVLGVRVWRVK